MAEEGFCLFFVLGSGGDSDRETKDILGVFIGGLGEYRVLLDTDRDVAHLVDGLGADAAEVLDAREHDVDELVEERLHALAAERDLESCRIARADLEGRDRFLGAAGSGSLAGDASEAALDEFDALLVLDRADAGRDHELGDARSLHHAGVSKILLHGIKGGAVLLVCGG